MFIMANMAGTSFKWKLSRVLLSVFLIVTMTVSLSGCKGKNLIKFRSIISSIFDDEYVSMVKNGHLHMAPNITVGDAFANFFGDPEWKSFESTSGQMVVEFNGDCTWQDKPAKCRMQFLINKKDDTFETGAVSINGTNLTVLETAAILAKIFSESSTDNSSYQNNTTRATLNLGEYVSKKDKLDVEIASIASDINNYLNGHVNFRGRDADYLIDKAKRTLDEVERVQNEVKQGQVRPEDEAVKQALLSVLDCEAGRIRGLYKGMLDSKNNGDYRAGFKDGTAAAYRYDDENSRLNAIYKR